MSNITCLTGRAYTPDARESRAFDLSGSRRAAPTPQSVDLGAGLTQLTIQRSQRASNTSRCAAVDPSIQYPLSLVNVIDQDGVVAVNPVTIGAGCAWPFSTPARTHRSRAVDVRNGVG